MNDAAEFIRGVGIVPRASVKDPEEAALLGKALVAGDIPVLELVYRDDTTIESLEMLSRDLPELLTGVSGIYDREKAENAISAGAGFLSGFGSRHGVEEVCGSKGILYIPCVSTAGEIADAVSLERRIVFFYPTDDSEVMGSIDRITGIFPQVSVIPAGSVSRNDLSCYFKSGHVHAVSVDWLTDRSMIEKRQYDEIACLAARTALEVQNFSLLHVGINNDSPEEAVAAAEKMSMFFGFKTRERPNSMFAGLGFEFMKTPDRGKNGHIAIGVNDVPRAVAYLRRKGIDTVPGTERINDDGTVRRVYLDLELSGFAFHLRVYP